MQGALCQVVTANLGYMHYFRYLFANSHMIFYLLTLLLKYAILIWCFT